MAGSPLPYRDLFSSQGMRVYAEQLVQMPDNLFVATAEATQSATLAQQPVPEAEQPQPTPQPQQAVPGAQPPQPTPQPQQPVPAIQPQQRGPQVQQPQPVKPALIKPPSMKKGEVSFNFDDADVFSVIQTIFGDVLKVNYIVDPSVKGRVNFRSTAPVAKEDVMPLMEVILRLNGIGVVEEGGLYRIVPIADISKEPSPVGVGREADEVEITGKALVQVVPIKYVQSSEMVRVLTPFLSKNAVIIDVPKSNYIIISDTDANVKRLLQLVEIFDSEELKAVTPQVYVYAVQNGKAKDVAALLQQIFLGAKAPAKAAAPSKTPGQTPAAQPVSIPQPQQQQGAAGQQGAGEMLVAETTRIIPDEVTNSIIILATPEDYRLIEKTLAQVDIAPRQVILEGLIVQVTLDNNLSFGLAWSLSTNVGFQNLKPFTTNPVPLTGNIGVNAPATTTTLPGLTQGFGFVATDPSGTARAVITALENRSKAKVLAAPHILVSDNREARIQVGSEIPLATSTTAQPVATSGTAVSTIATSTIQYKDIGIILKVKPQVNDSGLIALEISQEISSLGTSVLVGGLSEVSINKIEATTNLVSQDGDTIIIGGLIREDTTKSNAGIPFLSRIPVLGALFGNQGDVTERQELLILLTPHVTRSLREAKDATLDYVNRYKAETKDKQIDDFIRERSASGTGSERRSIAPGKKDPQESNDSKNSGTP